jgi:hypothetical protein
VLLLLLRALDGRAGSSSCRKKNTNTREPKNKEDAATRGEEGNAYKNAWRQNLIRQYWANRSLLHQRSIHRLGLTAGKGC